jgi:predicted TIM-barrel fold metal-dependent hydrolase
MFAANSCAMQEGSMSRQEAAAPSGGRIDVHHHLIPPAFVVAMQAKGLTEVAGTPLPDWTPEKSLENMDAHGIAAAILSLSAPGVRLGTKQEACSLARACNEYAAETRTRFGDRFGFFAVLPMPFTDEACCEAAYALDELRADGVVLLGSMDGIFLGDAGFDELMAELDRRKGIVFEHPNLHPTTSEIKTAMPGFMVEFLCDTTRAAANLIFSGTLEKYRDIRFILSHAGGFLPFIAWRLSLGNAMPELALKAPQGVIQAIRRFYYDTALSPSPYALAALRELVEEDHILFGSDYPFAPAVVTGLETRALDESAIFDAEVKEKINRGNALALFPHLANATVGEAHGLGRIRLVAEEAAEMLAEKARER